MIAVMKKFYIIFFVGFTALFAAEPTLGILTGVSSNNVLNLTIEGRAFTCKNYGILTLNEIEGLENTCKERLKAFELNNPQQRYFSQMHLKRYQQYPVIIVNKQECIVYAKGRKSLAELLLEAGLAIHKQSLQESITDYKYRRAVRRARNLKQGIYADAVLRNCIHLLK